jgi:hypothetical protein
MPERRAGANDLAGFIDAPEMKARKKIEGSGEVAK